MNLLTDEKKIKHWLNDMNIDKYTINSDFTIDVFQNVNISNQSLKHFPVKFNIIHGNFDCQTNELISLFGAPKEVKGNFLCKENQLTNLVYAPQIIEGRFNCIKNQITTLIGGPIMVGIGYNCSVNQLTNLQGYPKHLGTAGFAAMHNLLTTLEGAAEVCHGDFHCNDNKLQTLKYAPHTIEGSFLCQQNELSVLELDHFPKYIKGSVSLGDNPLVNIQALLLSEIKGNVYLSTDTVLKLFSIEESKLFTEHENSNYLNLSYQVLKPLLEKYRFDMNLKNIQNMTQTIKL